MPKVAIYRDDVMRWLCDTEPAGFYDFCTVELTEDERKELEYLLTQQARCQEMLRQLHTRIKED